MQSVFITGGTSGIGAALALEYLAQGYRVGVCGRHEENFHQNLGERKNLSFHLADVTKQEEIQLALESFAKEGGLDILVINAGISMAGKRKIPEFSRARKVVATNIDGFLNTLEKGLELYMTKDEGHERRGQVVVISSVAGFRGLPGSAAYSATKAFLTTFCQSLSIDLYQLGIDVTLVCPGFVDTPLTRQNKHNMPFLLPAAVAAQRIVKAVEKRRIFYPFPKRMYAIILAMRILPYACYVHLMRTIGKVYLRKEY